jgi:ferric-dicitrate binding protein FerR (iron transport regulator)
MEIVRFSLRTQLLAAMLLLAPTFLVAANSAMLTVSDSDSSSANKVLRSSALFVGDTVATRPDSVASINAEGSMVLVLADSSVRFEGNSVNMGHGGVVVTTSQAMAVRAGKLTIAPVAQRAAKFEVSASDGVVQIAAREGSLAIDDGSSTTILKPGQETTRQDSDQSEGPRKDQGAPPTGSGFHMTKKTAAIIFGGAAAAGTTAAILLTTGNGSRPVSPATP